MVLRFAPEVDDTHEPDLSELLDTAAFGDIARKYLGGIEAAQRLDQGVAATTAASCA